MENQTVEAKVVPNRVIPSHYRMQSAEHINAAIKALPRAEEMDLIAVGRTATADRREIPNWKTIRVDYAGLSRFVNCPTKKYQLVQHEEAFRPIIEGLTQAGEKNFQFVMVANHKKAAMQVYTTGVGYDTVSLGFSVTNTLDGTSTINYGFSQFREQKYIELVGYRQVCSNGMKIRVPLDEAEFVREEIRTKVQNLLSEHAAIKHTKMALERVQAMQYVTEALSLLREPVERMIKAAQKFTLDDEDRIKELIKKHVGKRHLKKIQEAYAEDTTTQGDLWGLYNAITYVASHDEKLKVGARETLLNKASNMLVAELTA